MLLSLRSETQLLLTRSPSTETPFQGFFYSTRSPSTLYRDTEKRRNLAPLKEPEAVGRKDPPQIPQQILTLWPFSPGNPARPSKPRSPCKDKRAASNSPHTVGPSGILNSAPWSQGHLMALKSPPASGHCAVCICHLLCPSKAEVEKRGTLLSPGQRGLHPWECSHAVNQWPLQSQHVCIYSESPPAGKFPRSRWLQPCVLRAVTRQCSHSLVEIPASLPAGTLAPASQPHGAQYQHPIVRVFNPGRMKSE